LIRRTPISQVAHVTTGYAAVKGRVVATKRPLSAPITGRACVAWSLEVLYNDAEGVATLFPSSGGKKVPCVVDDGTGLAEVDLTHAEIQWGRHERHFGDMTDAIERNVRSVFGPDPESTWIRACREVALQEGDYVFMMGPAAVDEGRVAGEPLVSRVLAAPEDAADWWVLSAIVAAGVLAGAVHFLPGLRSAQLGS
jgi:hypothetical protein